MRKTRRILYIGEETGTSLHRANALRRLGHQVKVIWPERIVGMNRLVDKWAWHTGGLFLEGLLRRRVMALDVDADLALVDSGALVGPSLVADLKKRFGTVINFNVDDPFGPRDGQRWRLYLKAVPVYDMLVVVRPENVDEAIAHGAKKVMHVFRAADEVAHSPGTVDDSARLRWSSEVSFIGTWMPERGPFFADLVAQGIPLSLYGDRWEQAREWRVLKAFRRGPALSGSDYRDAIKYSKICIGLVSKGNRDLHTQRSIEIPYIGSLLCAQRTSEHLAMYKEGEEAVFWEDSSECADVCRGLLADDARRARIALNGQRRAIRDGNLNEPLMERVLRAIHEP